MSLPISNVSTIIPHPINSIPLKELYQIFGGQSKYQLHQCALVCKAWHNALLTLTQALEIDFGAHIQRSFFGYAVFIPNFDHLRSPKFGMTQKLIESAFSNLLIHEERHIKDLILTSVLRIEHSGLQAACLSVLYRSDLSLCNVSHQGTVLLFRIINKLCELNRFYDVRDSIKYYEAKSELDPQNPLSAEDAQHLKASTIRVAKSTHDNAMLLSIKSLILKGRISHAFYISKNLYFPKTKTEVILHFALGYLYEGNIPLFERLVLETTPASQGDSGREADEILINEIEKCLQNKKFVEAKALMTSLYRPQHYELNHYIAALCKNGDLYDAELIVNDLKFYCESSCKTQIAWAYFLRGDMWNATRVVVTASKRLQAYAWIKDVIAHLMKNENFMATKILMFIATIPNPELKDFASRCYNTALDELKEESNSKK